MQSTPSLVQTKRLNEQVKRNQKRFPSEFMFQLTEEEKAEVVANCDHLTNLKYSPNLPYAFTEHGAVMLASVLNSERAIAVNIRIVKLFNAMRELAVQNKDILLKLEKIDKKLENMNHDVKMHDDEIETIFTFIDEIRDSKEIEKPRTPIGFKTKSNKKKD
jgi:hypothetical protein